MSVVGQPAGSRVREPLRRDPRAVAAGCAALVSAVLGVGQLLAAQYMHILAWRGTAQDAPSGIADEAALVIWLAAAAVGIGAAAPRLLLRLRPGRRMRLVLPAVSAFGALLAVPVATATASWSQLYGGNLSQLRAVWLVFLGVVLGGITALLVVRSRGMAWSLVCWTLTGWAMLTLGSRHLESAPVLGHLDPGPQWDGDSRLMQARLLLAAVGIVIGVGIGVAKVSFGWGKPSGRGRLRSISVVLPMFAGASGPGLMLAAYAVASATVGTLYSNHALGLGIAVLMAVVGAYLGATVARRMLHRDNA